MYFLFMPAALMLLCACGSKDTQIADNTFIHGTKIYKVIDNEVREIADINNDVKKFEALKPTQHDFGKYELSWVRQDAHTNLKALYRGNFLYYNLTVHGLNDLKSSFSRTGRFTLQFLDEYGFILHEVEVPITELTGVVNDTGDLQYYTYNGKTEMSTEINSAIKKYDVTAGLSKY